MAITRPSEWLDISSNVRKVVIKEFSLSPFPRLLGLGRTGRTFQMIVEKWIENTLKKEGELAKVVIVLDKDWNVKSAHIHAPYGQRLVEQLKKDGGGKVNLDTLKVTRIVRFVPEEGALFSLPAAEVVLDPEGYYKEGPRAYTNIPGAMQYVAIFEENLRKRGLPETSILTGD